MSTWDDVRRVATALPEVTERTSSAGTLDWQVKAKTFVWERPLRRADVKALGDGAPDGPILAAWVPDEGAKEALVAAEPEVFFTTPHFDGYAIVLTRLERIDEPELRELVVDAWLERAPQRLAKQYLEL